MSDHQAVLLAKEIDILMSCVMVQAEALIAAERALTVLPRMRAALETTRANLASLQAAHPHSSLYGPWLRVVEEALRP
jgi:hypothetical protein